MGCLNKIQLHHTKRKNRQMHPRQKDPNVQQQQEEKKNTIITDINDHNI